MEVSLSNKSKAPNLSSPSTSVRVLVRSSQSSAPKTRTIPSDPSSSSSSNGVVVVGFIGPRPAVTTQLVNRIVDANVFGSGNADQSLSVEKEELRDWFESRRISYHHDEQKGVLFLQFTPGSGFGSGSAVEEEELEFGDLQGMLFMFCVCHVIIHIQDGSRFDTQLLKKFRVLQAAKNGLAPFGRSGSASKRPATSATPQPHPRSASLMSGFGSYASLFPGQCTPVLLFVFLGDFFFDKESIDTLGQPSLQPKPSSPVVVLARPATRPPQSSGGFRKKVQSSLETQVRFLVKKCRILSGTETGPGGSRSGLLSSSPLFSLDSSRAVALLDRSTNRAAKALDFATSLVEEVLSGKATTDSLLLESHGQVEEDLLSVKDFIFRQCDILRGKGSLISNSTSGVGMVAAAAAAAAASAGKVTNSPELPNAEVWLDSSRVVLDRILSAKVDIEISKRKARDSSKGSDPYDIAVSWLGSCKGIDLRFSNWWCEQSLPAAKEVYLRDLPACYPSSTHEASLERALCAFRSMVKGPAVELFTQKLEDECNSIWESGRQLCDSVSLTGRPCVNKRHGSDEPHCSGFIFLHACACGRSRKPRPDPFDFDFSCSDWFADCDKLLPSLELPKLTGGGLVQALTWSLTRVGGAKYYDPSKGLIQSGFCLTQKFLSKWEILVENPITESMPEPVFEPEIVEDQTKLVEEKKISFGKFVPTTIMKKPFAEVVAGPGFRKQLAPSNVKPQKSEGLTTPSAANTNGEPYLLRMGSYGGTIYDNENVRKSLSLTSVTVAYVGFEHECPRGHRFLLNPKHLEGLGGFYQNPSEEIQSSGHNINNTGEHHKPNTNSSKLNNNNGRRGRAKKGNSDLNISFGVSKLEARDLGRDFRSSLDCVHVDQDSKQQALSLLNRDLPLYMNCPHCSKSRNGQEPKVNFAGTVSQLQRIFLVTPPYPIVLSTCPVVQFEASCLPELVEQREEKLRFSIECEVVLPPESFLTLRLPFIYGVEMEGGDLQSLKCFENQPESTAWIKKGTALNIISKTNITR